MKEKKKPLNICIKPTTRLLAESAAALQGISLSSFLELATKAYVANLSKSSQETVNNVLKQRLEELEKK